MSEKRFGRWDDHSCKVKDNQYGCIIGLLQKRKRGVVVGEIER